MTNELRAAAELVRFAKTAPGRLPSAVQDAIATIEAALAAEQPQPEPVAWICDDVDGDTSIGDGVTTQHVVLSRERPDGGRVPLYASPPAPAEQPQPVACPDCNGTGLRDSGGVMPWGEPAMVPCDCSAPPAPAGQPQPVAWRYPMYWWQPMEQHAEWHYISDLKRISAAAHDAGIVPEPLYAAPPAPAAAPITDAMVEAALAGWNSVARWSHSRERMRAAIDAALAAREGR